MFSIKRFMGRRFDEVQEEIKMVPYKVVKSGDHVAVLAQGKGVHASAGLGADFAEAEEGGGSNT